MSTILANYKFALIEIMRSKRIDNGIAGTELWLRLSRRHSIDALVRHQKQIHSILQKAEKEILG